MVVLAASIINKSGKVLVSRQFVDMSRIRIEGHLAAFPKLVCTGKQHTYVETDNARYVYQPIEAFYLLLVTNKTSNILEDLDTLTLFSKIVSEYVLSLDEEGICKAAFELIWALDEAISFGQKENVTVAQVKQYCEMDSHEEKLHKIILQSKINETKGIMKRKAIEINKNKIDRNRGEKGGFGSGFGGASERIERTFSDMSISSIGSGFGGGSGFGVTTDLESFSSAKGPAKGLGMQLGKSKKSNQLLQSLKAEGELILEDVQPVTGLSKAVALPLTDPVTLNIEEKLNITLKKDGGISNFDLQGTLSLQILNQEDAHIQVQIENGANPGIIFKTHPNMNKELFSNENTLGLKDPDRPFPTGQAGDTGGIGLLKWRMESQDESMVPLIINCWPSDSGDGTYVNIDYEAQPKFDLRNVVISVPLPALREAPNVNEIDGEWRYDSRKSILEWSILLIDNSNRSGALEFVIPRTDSSVFFPISVRFSATSTFSDLKVVNILPLKGRSTPKFSQRTQLITENYQVV